MKNLKKVLIVEDEAAFMVAISEELKAQGLEVLVAMDGKMGLEVALKERPDLILLDCLLPVISGIEMLRELRKDEWGKDAYVVLLTEVYESEVIAAALSNGVSKYFVKADHTISSIIEEIKKYFE